MNNEPNIKNKFRSPKGMRDLLSPLTDTFDKIFVKAKKFLEERGFTRIEPPILEKTEVFVRGIGEHTDIVEKEMYNLQTPGGDKLTLRPEYTAGICRAYLEQGMTTWPKPVKLWYFGPVFRHEKPQALRWRELWQLGFEIIGDENPVLDAQTILYTKQLLEKFGLKNFTIIINSLGDEKCREKYLKELKNYLKTQRRGLCETCKKRVIKNPLRVLDCKEEKCQYIVNQGPLLPNSLCKGCKEHFRNVLEYLEGWGVNFELEPTLVRGLDYYTRTVFEVVPAPLQEEEKTLSVAGGGRYDYLIELFGEERTPAVGMAIGIDRVVHYIGPQKTQIKYDFFVAQLGERAKKESAKLVEELRAHGFRVAELLSRSSLRSQLTRANKLGIRYVLLLGQKEIVENTVILKDLQEHTQEIVPRRSLIKNLKKLKK